MTVICYRNGVIAADRLQACRGIRVGTITKIFRTPKAGLLVGVAGPSLDCTILKVWANANELGMLEQRMPDLHDKNTDMLVAFPDGRLFLFNGEVSSHFEVEASFHATGSGMDIALGAMAAGVDAREAALIACRLEVHCGGGVDWLDHDGNGGRIDG